MTCACVGGRTSRRRRRAQVRRFRLRQGPGRASGTRHRAAQPECPLVSHDFVVGLDRARIFRLKSGYKKLGRFLRRYERMLII